MTAEKARLIYFQFHSRNISVKRLAKFHGFSEETIYSIVRGKLYAEATSGLANRLSMDAA